MRNLFFFLYGVAVISIIAILTGCMPFTYNARAILDNGQEVQKAKVDHKRKVIEVQYK